jgi:hypothetical protein
VAQCRSVVEQADTPFDMIEAMTVQK